jgi:hypothetical protein
MALSQILVRVDGIPVPHTYDPETGTIESCVTLGEGNHTIKVDVWDRAGNSGVAHAWLMVDTTPPEATFYQPSDGGAYNATNIEVEAYITDNLSGVDQSAISVRYQSSSTGNP